MRQRWHYIIGSLRDGKLHVRHKRSLFFNSQWYNLSYSDITGSYIKAGAVPRPLSNPFILQMWRLRKNVQGHSERVSLWLTQHRLEPSALRGDSERDYLFSTWVLKGSGKTLSWPWSLLLRSQLWAQHKYHVWGLPHPFLCVWLKQDT